MLIFIVAAGAGLLLGLVRGGRVRHLAALHLRGAPLVWVALAAQVGLGVPTARDLPTSVRTGIVLGSLALVGLFLAVNIPGRRGWLRTGTALLALGWALNAVVVGANGGMPVSAAALQRSGLPDDVDVADGHLWKHRPVDDHTRLVLLGDVLAVPRVPAAFSVGDVAMVAGIVVAVAAGVTGPSRRRSEDGLRSATAVAAS